MTGFVDAPEATLRLGTTPVRILGTIAGFAPDGQRVAAALVEPVACVALGVPPEDLEALAQLAKDPALHTELPELDEWTERLFEYLAAWGETCIPSPDLAAAYAGAMRHGAQVTALDLDDDTHTEEHTKRLKFRHLVRMNRVRNKMLKSAFDAPGPYDLAQAWDAREHGIPPLRAIQEEREAHMAKRLEVLAREHASILAVVPAPRFPGIVARLRATEEG